MKHGNQLSFAFGFGLLEYIANGHQMSRASLGRNISHEPVGNAGQPNGVSLLYSQITDRAGELSRVVEFRISLRAEVHRAAGIDY
jgi:hypothetical protein